MEDFDDKSTLVISADTFTVFKTVPLQTNFEGATYRLASFMPSNKLAMYAIVREKV